jgi:glucokinase
MTSTSETEPYFLGIDLGGSRIKSVVVNARGQTLEHESMPFEDRAMEWADRIRDRVEALRLRRGEPAAVGLSAPGLAARDGRCILHMPGRLHGLEGLDWQRFLTAPAPIPVLNDAHAALLGEAWMGAAQGLENVFMLTLGTGVGGAAIVDGRLLRGNLGRAGHLGHITLDSRAQNDDVGTPGSLEMAIGNKTLTERSHGCYTSTETLVQHARSGDPKAVALWQESVRGLAVGINSLINVLDPEAVILGGGIAQAGPDLFDRLSEILEGHEWRPRGARVRLLPAALSELAGAYGAARQAILSRQEC